MFIVAFGKLRRFDERIVYSSIFLSVREAMMGFLPSNLAVITYHFNVGCLLICAYLDSFTYFFGENVHFSICKEIVVTKHV